MARINVNMVNVLTGDDSNAYRSADLMRPVCPEITIPRFRARLSINDAKLLSKALIEAVRIAEDELAKAKGNAK